MVLLLFHSQAKQKQKGAKHVTFPSVQGYNTKWIVIDYGNTNRCVFVHSSLDFVVVVILSLLMCVGKFVVHALDEKARAYFNLESLWSAKTSDNDNSDQVNISTFFYSFDVDWYIWLNRVIVN